MNLYESLKLICNEFELFKHDTYYSVNRSGGD